MANEIFEAPAGFLVGTGEGAQVLLGGLARKCRVGRSSTPDQRRRAESVDMSGCARRWKPRSASTDSAGRMWIVLPALLARFCGGAGVGSGAWVPA